MYWNERNVGCCFPIRIFLEHTGKNVAEMGIAFVWGNLVPDEYCGIQFLWKKEKSTSGNWQTLTHVSVYSFHYSNNNLFLLHGSLYSLLPRLWGHKFYQSMPRVSLWASLVAQLVKKSICNAGDPSSIPGSGRSVGEETGYPFKHSWASLVSQLVKNLPAMQETWVWSLDWDDPLEKGKATHSSILAWRILWMV